MTKFINISANLTARPKLYRVWVPMYDDGRAPLISIWIDPTMAALVSTSCPSRNRLFRRYDRLRVGERFVVAVVPSDAPEYVHL